MFCFECQSREGAVTLFYRISMFLKFVRLGFPNWLNEDHYMLQFGSTKIPYPYLNTVISAAILIKLFYSDGILRNGQWVKLGKKFHVKLKFFKIIFRIN